MATLLERVHSNRLWWKLALAALVLYTLVGFLVVPWIARKVIVSQAQERLGREVSLERIRFNPFTLTMTLEGFSLPDRPGSTLVSFDRLVANAQLSSLFRWAATLKELRIENPYAGLRRFEDGEINVLEVWQDFKERSEPADDERGLPRALLQQIEISDGRLEAEDRAVTGEPKLWEWGPAQVSLDDISTLPDRQGDDEVTLALPEGGRLHMAGTLVPEPFHAEGTIDIEGALLRNAWRAVTEKFGFDLSDGRLAAQLEYDLTLQDDGPHVEIRQANLGVTDVRIEEIKSGTELFRLDSTKVTGLHAKWPEQSVEAESIVVDGVYAHAWLEPDGTPSWDQWVPEPTREEAVEAYDYLAERIDVEASLGRFEVRNASAALEDRTFAEPERLELAEAALVLTDITTRPEEDWGIEASATLAGEARASAEGSVGIAPLALEAEVALEGLELSQFQPYLERFAPVELQSGSLTTAGRARFSPSPDGSDLTFTGGFSVNDLELNETVTNGLLVRWSAMDVQGVQAGLLPMMAEVESVDLHEAGLDIEISEDGTVNLREFANALNEARSEVAAGDSPEEAELPPVRIARVELHDARGRFANRSMAQTLERKLEPINGTITGIDTQSSDGAEVDIEAVVDSGGLIRVAGQIDPVDFQRFAVLEVDIQDVLLPPMSPQLVEMIGFPAQTGRLTLDSSLDVQERQLTSTNLIEIDNLTLGEKVEGEGQVGLPVKLGLSLLKDSNGKIEMDVPVSGDLGNPQFVVLSAIKGAALDMVGEVAKSPFKLLARLGGGSDDQSLDAIDFSAGFTVLESAAQANLTTLANALAQRPELTVQIEGVSSPQADSRALGEQALADELGGEELSEVPTSRLEELFTGRLSSDELDSLRQKLTAETPEPAQDDTAYREALLAVLVEEQSIDESLVAELATDRAEAIRAFLVDESGVDPARVSLLPVVTADDGEAAEDTDGGRVRCRLALQTKS